jgi:hypothetical protein
MRADKQPTISKKEADYRRSFTLRRCEACSMYRAGSCTLVQGKIDPSYTCKYWEPKL